MSAIGPRQRAAVARIDYKLPGGAYGRGTGFAVTPDHIITANHVMDPNGRDFVAVFGGNRPPVALGAVKAPLRRNVKLSDDWVLVECAVPDDIDPIELAPLEVKENGQWRTWAYPQAVLEAAYPAGVIASWTDGIYALQLDGVFSGLNPAGASGAPIFVEERAVGVLVMTRGDSGGLHAIDAKIILADWPDGPIRPVAVPSKVPYEAWVRQTLAAMITGNTAAQALAASIIGLDADDATPLRLTRVLLTSVPDRAIDFVKRFVSNTENRALLVELSKSLWVHHGAASSLGELAFKGGLACVLRCQNDVSVLHHLCCAEGLTRDGLPRCRDETLFVTYDNGEPSKTRLLKLVRAQLERRELLFPDEGDDELVTQMNANFVALAVELEPPADAIAELRRVGITMPVVVYSGEATDATAALSGGKLIVPYPDRRFEPKVRSPRRTSAGGGT